jgi:hypothetical protein
MGREKEFPNHLENGPSYRQGNGNGPSFKPSFKIYHRKPKANTYSARGETIRSQGPQHCCKGTSLALFLPKCPPPKG